MLVQGPPGDRQLVPNQAIADYSARKVFEKLEIIR
jgi:hypothetical protein